MTVPRQAVVDRLTQNAEDLLSRYRDHLLHPFEIEVSDPFESTGNSGGASPFIRTLFPDIKGAATLERALNTALGWGWDKVVADIALATYGNGEHDHEVTGAIPVTTSNAIEATINEYRGTPRIPPNTPAELAAILPTVNVGGAQENVSEKDDAFFVDQNGVENHIEIKTPKPNYDQTKAAKRRILRIHAVRAPTNVKAFVGMPYNPNGRFGPYGWPVTPIYLDFNEDLLIGEEFWNYVGDSPDTYDELLDCFYEVGLTYRDELIQLLSGGA